jgi:hypothetical protein
LAGLGFGGFGFWQGWDWQGWDWQGWDWRKVWRVAQRKTLLREKCSGELPEAPFENHWWRGVCGGLGWKLVLV